MARLTPHLIKALCAGLLLTAIGCQDQSAEIERLGQELTDKDRLLRDLEAQLAECQAGRVAAEDQGLGLRNERDRLNAELAALRADQSNQSEGWQTVPAGALINIEGEVLFDSGSPELRAEGKQMLSQIAATLSSQYGDHDVYVFGHTDNEAIKVSGWKDNYELSCQRALAVVRYLRSQGLGQHLAACGWGEYRPIADNATEPGRQMNRRVQIFAYKAQ